MNEGVQRWDILDLLVKENLSIKDCRFELELQGEKVANLSIQGLTWQRYFTYVKRYLTFTQEQITQMANFAVIIFVICFLYHIQQHGWKRMLMHIPAELLISLWIAFIAGMTLINRSEGSSELMYFNPLITFKKAYHGNVFEQFQMISNVALFVPYGFLIPLNFQRCRKIGWCALFCACSTLMIEMTQHITRRGIFDTSDMILNFAGGMIGYLIYLGCAKIRIWIGNYFKRS